MQRMRLIRALLVASLVAIGTVACGGNDDSPPASSPQQPVSPPQQPSTPDGAPNPTEPAKPDMRCAP
ncbi:hypothetical protein [Cupriavidus metallidurans]|nr:hypothetical protein [Cupriavidus metallidurans]QGS31334.1 hypothetical protein FOB83_20590 [Cupriavidus metallidurans]